MCIECASHKHETHPSQTTSTWKWHQSINRSAKYKKESVKWHQIWDYTQAWKRGDLKWHKPHLTRGLHKPRVKIGGISLVITRETNSCVRVCTEAEKKERKKKKGKRIVEQGSVGPTCSWGSLKYKSTLTRKSMCLPNFYLFIFFYFLKNFGMWVPHRETTMWSCWFVGFGSLSH